MHKTKKGVIGLLMAMAMMVTLCIPALANESMHSTILGGPNEGRIVVSESQIDDTRAGGYNPNFYSGKVYGYNPTTNYIALAGQGTWNWGPVQPDYLSVVKEDYWWLAANGYEDWYFEYTWNSKDSTYIKIYDSYGEVFIESAVTPNTTYDISFFSRGMSSQIDLRMDWIVGGMRVNDVQIGGMKVIYN